MFSRGVMKKAVAIVAALNSAFKCLYMNLCIHTVALVRSIPVVISENGQGAEPFHETSEWIRLARLMFDVQGLRTGDLETGTSVKIIPTRTGRISVIRLYDAYTDSSRNHEPLLHHCFIQTILKHVKDGRY